MAGKLSVDLSLNAKGYVKGAQDASYATKTLKQDTDAYIKEYGTLNKQMRAASMEAKNLAAQFYSLSDAEKNSDIGKQLELQMNQAIQKAGSLKDVMGDTMQRINHAASDTAGLDATIMAFQGAAAAASVYTGALSLLGVEDENLEKQFAKVQGALTLLNGIQSVANVLNKDSVLIGKIKDIQSKMRTASLLKEAAAETTNTVATTANSGATKINTGSKILNTAATKAATVAQAAFNVVAKANPYVLLASAIIAVGVALTALSFRTNKAKEAEEEHQRVLEETRKRNEELRDSYTSASQKAYETASIISNLRAEYMSTNDELKKTEILATATEHFKQLGLACNNVNDAHRLLIQQGDQVIEMLRLQGDAAGLAAVRAELYAESFKAILNNRIAEGFDFTEATRMAGQVAGAQLGEIDKQIATTTGKAKQLYKLLGGGSSKKTGGKTTTTVEVKYEPGSIADIEAQIQRLNNNQKNKVNPLSREEYEKELARLQKELKEKKLKAGLEVEVTYQDYSTEWFKKKKEELQKQLDGLEIGSEAYRNIQQQIKDLELTEVNLKASLNAEEIHKSIQQEVADALKIDEEKPDFSYLSDAMKKEADSVQTQIDKIETLMERYEAIMADPKVDLTKLDATTKGWQMLKVVFDQLIAKRAEYSTQNEGLKTQKEQIDKIAKASSIAGEQLQNFGSLLSSLGDATDDKGLKAGAIVAEALATLALSFAQVMKSTRTWYEWLAFGITGTAALVSMTAQIKSLTSGYAEGGIISGSSFHGDNVLARVNSGEMIINQRQQRNLFDAIDQNKLGGGSTRVEVFGKIRGTDILLVGKNQNKINKLTGTNITWG